VVPHLQLLTLGAPLLLTQAGEQVRFRTRKHFALLIASPWKRDEAHARLPDGSVVARCSGAAGPPPLAQALTVMKEKVGATISSCSAPPSRWSRRGSADVGRLVAGETQIRGQFLDGSRCRVPCSSSSGGRMARQADARIRDCLVKQMDGGRRIGDFGAVEQHGTYCSSSTLCPRMRCVASSRPGRGWAIGATALKVYGGFEERLADELGRSRARTLCASRI